MLGWLLLAVAHVGDRYQVGHVQGAWMALARYANEGTLYPALYDGSRYGGTRWLPLPVLVNAAAARLTGEYLTSGKTVSIVLFGALLAVVFVVLRTMRCPGPIAFALTGILAATQTSAVVGATIGGDVLPALLQVAALLVVATGVQRDERAWMAVAGVLAGLAAVSKLSAVWALLAIATWLMLKRDWQRLLIFLGAGAATAVAVLSVVQVRSEGRFLETVLTTTLAGTGGPVGWVRAPNQLMLFGNNAVPAVWMLVPFAVLGLIAARRAEGLTLYHHALLWSALLTLIVFTDMGSGLNHMLDVAVLATLSVGYLAGSLPDSELGSVSLATAVAVAVLWAGVTGIRDLVPELRPTLTAIRTGVSPSEHTRQPLADIVEPGDELLSEDPSLPVLLGRTPVVLDPFMLRRIDEVQPDVVDELVDRIERTDFDHVTVSTHRLESDDFWWEHYHFGLRVVTALREHYAFVEEVDGYYLYAPARATGPGG
jgi:hypothetical protein